MTVSNRKKEKEEKKEIHNYLYLKFYKVTELLRFLSKLFQILAP